MSVAERVDWDLWRASYSSMSFAEHQAFNAECLRLYPEQRSWNADVCAGFIEERRPKHVAEIGGWDGALADLMLDRFPFIEQWTNYDITPGVPQTPVGDRYQYRVLDDWPWRSKVSADALVASHVFEHMRMYEIEMLLTEWDVRSVYVDCPIGPGMSSWHGYDGSHILAVGSTEFLYRLAGLGYEASWVDADGGLLAYLDWTGS